MVGRAVEAESPAAELRAAVIPAMSASRGGVRMPFPTRSITRKPTTCHAAPATAISGRTSTAVA